jgi:hypothetical protein
MGLQFADTQCGFKAFTRRSSSSPSSAATTSPKSP